MRYDRLPKTGFLSAASAPLREMLESQASEVRLSNGEVLFEQGDKILRCTSSSRNYFRNLLRVFVLLDEFAEPLAANCETKFC